jgi:uncharacterized protein
MKKALEFILKNIVEKEDEVKVEETEDQGVINFVVSVAKDDMGKVIGKNGKVIKAIRNVIKIPAIKQNKKIFINLSENQ